MAAIVRRLVRSAPTLLLPVVALAAMASLPAGAQEVREVGPGTYAVLTSNVARDSNKGFVVGSDGVLLVDGSDEGTAMLLAAVRTVTSLPILYSVALNYHEDHAGGADQLPDGVTFVAHQTTLDTLVANGAKVATPTLPFTDRLRLDLGDRHVDIRHFGKGNTLGDAIVHVPDASVAYTGNLIYGQGSIPWLNPTTNAEEYLRATARLAASIDASVIVPGHGAIAAASILSDYTSYLAALAAGAHRAVEQGLKLSEAAATLPYVPSANLETADPFFVELMPRVHGGNVEIAFESAVQRTLGSARDEGRRSDSYDIRRLGDRVYALLPLARLTSGTGLSAVANSGFVVGDRAVLVVDAGTNAFVAKAIQDAVASVTDLPIRYVVNTSDHGDHTFGNEAFTGALVVAQSANAERMRQPDYFARESAVLTDVVGIVQSREALADVRVRWPDISFDDTLSLDLGGVDVELHHFGAAHTEGDVVVYVPAAQVAWGGNFLFGVDSVPFLFEGRPREYIESVAALGDALPIHRVVTGHFSIADRTILSRYLDYLTSLVVDVRGAIRAGLDEQATVDAVPIPNRFDPGGAMGRFWASLHSSNVRKAFQELG